MEVYPVINFYALEDGDDTEEVKESEILVINDSSLAAYNQKFVKRKFSFINTFDHEGPAEVSAMGNLTIRVF